MKHCMMKCRFRIILNEIWQDFGSISYVNVMLREKRVTGQGLSWGCIDMTGAIYFLHPLAAHISKSRPILNSVSFHDISAHSISFPVETLLLYMTILYTIFCYTNFVQIYSSMNGPLILLCNVLAMWHSRRKNYSNPLSHITKSYDIHVNTCSMNKRNPLSFDVFSLLNCAWPYE